jgi:hypothetical protein
MTNFNDEINFYYSPDRIKRGRLINFLAKVGVVIKEEIIE